MGNRQWVMGDSRCAAPPLILNPRFTMTRYFTAIIEREGDGFVSLCPELDIASQDETITEAQENLREALSLFFETASSDEIHTRLQEEVHVRRLEVAVG